MRALPLVRSSVFQVALLGLGVAVVATAVATRPVEAQRSKKKKPADDSQDISKIKQDLVVLTDDDGDFFLLR